MACELVVGIGGRQFSLDQTDALTFGRASTCTVCLDPADQGISRTAGSFEYDSGTWWLLNRSNVRPVEVVDDVGMRTIVPPGRRVAVTGPITVVVEGAARRHAITVEPTNADGSAAPLAIPVEGNPTYTSAEVTVTEADKAALVALFAGYLEPFPRYDPHPKSYAEAAARLQVPRTTLVKRIEYLRTRLTNAGVPNLLGDNALVHLAEWALATGLVTRSDLDLLPPR